MVDSVFVLALTGLCIAVMRLIVFAYLWQRESAGHLKLWAQGFTAQIFAQLLMLPTLVGNHHPVPQLLGLGCTFVAAALLLKGTWHLLGRKLGRSLWWAGALAALASAAVTAATGSILKALTVPVLGLGFAYASMAIALFKSRREMSGLGVGLTIFALALTGLHFADFPFLADVPRFIPWGIGLGLFNDVALTVGLIVLTFDRTHAARKLAVARYEELADIIGVGTYTSTTAGRFSEVNGALVRMLGYESAHEVTALDTRTLSLSPGGAIECERLVGVEAVWRRKDGRPLVVQLHGRALRDAEGQVIAWRGIVVDRTEAHAIEEALQRTQKLDAVGRLAGGIAHDFNNLLTIILSSLELLSLKQSDDPALLAEAMEATDQAAQLTRRLLAFGRKQAHHAQPIDVSATTLRTVEMLGRSLGSRHSVDVSGVTAGLWTSMDPGHLEQVLVNLVLNAKDAMADGGTIVVMTCSVERGGRAGVELSVRDPGHGMTPEQQARIFEPFFTTRDPGRGTGLGLSTVHGIVSQAGGHIEVQSAPQQGARFSLWFPATAAPRPAAPSAISAPSGKRVLVVDDEAAIRRTVCRMLEASGHVTCEASSGNQALALIAGGEAFDLVLSDVRMPDGDGVTTARELRRRVPGLRVVLMSGFQDASDARAQAGADGFLAKPFTRAELLAEVEHLRPYRAAG